MIAIYGAYDSQELLLTEFRGLAATGIVPIGTEPGHKDGYGIIAYDRDSTNPRVLVRKPTDASTDPDYQLVIDKIQTSRPKIVLGHLRKKSCGPTSIENTQPFTDGSWSFAHNGTVWSPGLSRFGNENDSRAYFRTLLHDLSISNSGDSLCAAIVKLREKIVHDNEGSERPYSSLTCLLSDGTSMYVVRDYADESETNYYTMYYCSFQNGIVFCQEKIIDLPWKELPNKTTAAFQPDGRLRVLPCT